MQRILITGATGFIGRACLKALEQVDIEVHAIYRNKPIITNSHVCWHHCDILNPKDVSVIINKVKPDYLLHLAWIVDHNIYWTSDKNIDYQYATINLYKEFSSQGGKKALFIGTCAEYDRSYSICDENNTPLNPNTLYGICKKQTHELLKQLKIQDTNLADFTWVRLFNIFGPHEHEDRLIPYIFLSYLKGKPPVLQSPQSIRDYIHVQNLADLLVALLLKHSVSVINAGSGIQLSILDLATIISLRYFKAPTQPHNEVGKLSLTDRFIPDLTLLDKLNHKQVMTFESSLDDMFTSFKYQLQKKK